jgi:tripartite-type tricarboxylate transporter receptor subunit TctC
MISIRSKNKEKLVKVSAKFRLAALGVLGALLAPVSGDAFAQAWPNKPIKFVVPFATGGVADVVARTIAPKLGEALGQPIVIENKGGAGGTIGTAQGAKAAPDGYTFVVPAASHTTTPGLYASLPFDPVKDFVAVTQVVTVPYMLVVHPSNPANSVREFIALAKAKPGTLVYGSAGNGSSNHLAGELFEIMAGVDMIHSPYKGSGPALTDVMGGHINFMFDTINTSVGHINAGTLKTLGIGTLKPSKVMPGVPTIASTVPGFEAATWIGILAPLGTPKEIVTRMNREIVKVLQNPEVQQRLATSGAEPVGSTPEEFDASLKSEVAKWGRVIKQAGVPPVQ